MIRPNLMLSIKIAELFAMNEVGCVTIYDENLEMYDGAIVRVELANLFDFSNGKYDILFTPETFSFKNEDDAVFYINDVLDGILATVKTMSN